VLAGGGKATVSEAEEVLLLIVDSRGHAIHLPGFQLQLVTQRGILFLCSERRFAQGVLS